MVAALPARRPDLGARLPADARCLTCCASGCPTRASASSSTSPSPPRRCSASCRSGSSCCGAAGRRSGWLPHPGVSQALLRLAAELGLDRRDRSGPARRPGSAARRVPDGHRRRGVQRAGRRTRRFWRRPGPSAGDGNAGSWWASIGWTTPRAFPAGSSPTSRCCRPIPNCGNGCAWSRWPCPPVPGSRPTRIFEPGGRAGWPDQRGLRHPTLGAGALHLPRARRAPSWWPCIARPTSCW